MSSIFTPPLAEASEAPSACARAPIHAPGNVQPHGALICMDESLKVVQVSRSLEPLTGTAPQHAVGRHFGELAGESAAQRLREAVRRQDLMQLPLYLGLLHWGERGFDASVHRHDGLLMLEIEPSQRQVDAGFGSIYPLVRSFVSKLQEADTVEDLCELAADEMKSITGFGRVLVCRFDDEGHGQVLASVCDDGYESYRGMYFPACDLPPQARELSLRNRLRLVADANDQPSPLLPADNPRTGAATDLTFAALRGVSPRHVQSMKNMGTLASMSISIIVRGTLWGLISCHHATPRFPPFDARTACEHLGQILSLQIEAKEERAEALHRLELRRMLVSLLAAIADSDSFVEGLISHLRELLRFAGAGGAAVVFEGRCTRFGDTPSEREVRRLVDWLSAHSSRSVYASHCLAKEFPGGETMAECAAGVMAVSISQLHRNYVLWFRPEQLRTVTWAGRPGKTFGRGGASMPHRRSGLPGWTQTVRGVAQPWRGSEIETALEFRNAVLAIVLRRAEEMAMLASELERSNRELEAFSYSVSHDLRAPLRHIVGYAELLRELEAAGMSERGLNFLKNIEDSAAFAGTLVDDLLSFSQMGRAALRPTRVDVRRLAESVIGDLQADAQGREVRWELGRLPTVRADPTFLQMAMRNLMSNALKYSRGRSPAVIGIDGEETETSQVVHVRDNGVGFDMKYAGKLFGVFQRLHRMEDFEGTGIGLANVRRIIERHDGRVWAEGEVDRGAVFSFELPKAG